MHSHAISELRKHSFRANDPINASSFWPVFGLTVNTVFPLSAIGTVLSDTIHSMSIVLSHTTAKAVYQAACSVSAEVTEPCSPAAIYGSCPSGTLLDAAAKWLTKHNVTLDANDSLEVMVFDRKNARYAMNCQCHVSSKRFSSSRFIELGNDVYIAGVELCALQAATYLSFRELVEYYFELCSTYSLGTSSSTSYTERIALTSTERLKQFFNSITRCDGLTLARKAIQCVRDGCRSPMETAFVMMLTLPKSEGGLGIKGVETDYEVQVTAAAKNLTRRKKFFMDAYLKKISHRRRIQRFLSRRGSRPRHRRRAQKRTCVHGVRNHYRQPLFLHARQLVR